MASNFERALDPTFIANLAAEARKEGWWFDVLTDPKLLVALRGSYLNVYWHGQSLFCITAKGTKVTTHAKYLVDPALASQVELNGGKFNIKELGFIGSYEYRKTIAKMKKAAGLFSKPEKIGCHEIAVRNSGIVDCEITFPGTVSLEDGGTEKKAPRVDLASLEPFGDKALLVFWEAKHYSNGELRRAGGPAPVLRQVRFYKKYLSDNRKDIEKSYTKVAANLVSISNMGWQRQLSPLIRDVGTGKRVLTLGEEPDVRLIIFGFDSAQRDDTAWKGHLKKLEDEISILPVGDAKGITLPA